MSCQPNPVTEIGFALCFSRAAGRSLTMTKTPSSDDDLRLLRRHWPHGYGADHKAVWAAAEALYGRVKGWEGEFASDLGGMRPDGQGGMETKGRIDRMLMKRWREGTRPIPPWVSEGLLRLPEIVLARRRRDTERWLEQLREDEREAKAYIAGEEARLRGWVAAQIDQHVPSVVRDPVKRPPPPRTATPDREWPPVSADEIEAAEDIGMTAARVAMGVVEHEDALQPEHPTLADAWERGWTEAYDYQLSTMQEATERRAAAKAEAEAAAEAARAAKAKEEARKDRKRAADRARRRSK